MEKTRVIAGRYISAKTEFVAGPIFFWKVPEYVILPEIPKRGRRPEAVVETVQGLARIAMYKSFNVEENEKVHDKRTNRFLDLEEMKSVVMVYPEK